MSGVVHAYCLSPNTLIISLQSHAQNGPQPESALVAMIMSINPEMAIGKTEVQKKFNGNNCGMTTTIRYSQKLFDGDLSLQDNKFKAIVANRR
eukprot:6075595-Ditylum_brightwellii.AAC.2